MAKETAETRSEVFSTPSLHELLREKTTGDYQKRWVRSHPTPPVYSMIVTTIAGAILAIAEIEISYVFFAISAILFLWIVVVYLMRSSNSMVVRCKEIAEGKFPSDSANIVLMRLRWWNHLIQPQRWAKHSRIFDVEKRLKNHLEKCSSEIDRLIEEEIDNPKTEEPEEEKAKGPPAGFRFLPQSMIPAEEEEEEPEEQAPPFEPEMNQNKLNDRLINVRVRVEYMRGLDTMEDEMAKVKAKIVLYKTLLERASKVTKLLGTIKEQELEVTSFGKKDINEFVNESIDILEKRRANASMVDTIDPTDLIAMLSV